MIDDDQMIQAIEHKYKFLHNNGLSLLWGRLYSSLIKTILFQYLFLETWTEILIVSAYYFIPSSFVRSKIVQEINSKAKKCKNRDEKKFRKTIPPLPKKNLFKRFRSPPPHPTPFIIADKVQQAQINSLVRKSTTLKNNAISSYILEK